MADLGQPPTQRSVYQVQPVKDFLSGTKKKDHTHYFNALWYMPRSRRAGGLRGRRGRMLSGDSRVEDIRSPAGTKEGHLEAAS